MQVFVVVHHWDTPDNEGVEVLGVFEKIEKARAQIVAGAGAIRAEYVEDFWDEDMSWDEPMSIHLGRCGRDYLEQSTVYSWEISEQEVE